MEVSGEVEQETERGDTQPQVLGYELVASVREGFPLSGHVNVDIGLDGRCCQNILIRQFTGQTYGDVSSFVVRDHLKKLIHSCSSVVKFMIPVGENIHINLVVKLPRVGSHRIRCVPQAVTYKTHVSHSSFDVGNLLNIITYPQRDLLCPQLQDRHFSRPRYAAYATGTKRSHQDPPSTGVPEDVLRANRGCLRVSFF